MNKIKKITINGKEYIDFQQTLKGLELLSESMVQIGDMLGAAYIGAVTDSLKHEENYDSYPKKTDKDSNVTNLFGE